jgi:diketogulonate reductase-like aldo/keto reductase
MVPNIELSNKTKIPQIGFGLWQIDDEDEAKRAVRTALEAGYRHFDTAQIYRNEQFVGSELARSATPRDELFITTKIWNDNMNWDILPSSFDISLEKLQTEYVDLLLLHFPVTERRGPAWRRMEEILASGRARAIGVSNYTIDHLEELLRQTSIKPAVNQVELHVFLQQPELVKYCEYNDIAVEAYSPLVHGVGMDNPVLTKIAQKYNKTTAQIMIRWCLDKNLIPLPKSIRPDRIRQNFQVFDFSLDSDDLEQIKGLDKNLRTAWDPTNIP